MRINTNRTLEFDTILERLSEFALSQNAKDKLLLLKPFLSESQCKAKIRETTAAVKLIGTLGTPPVAAMKELAKILALTEKGSMLSPGQLGSVAAFLSACKRMKGYLKKGETLSAEVASYGGSLSELAELGGEIDRTIRNGAVDSDASPALRDARRKIENTHTAIKAKLESLLRGEKKWFADGYVTTRNGRFVLPVKKEYKNQVSGSVIDTSSTGSTCFIEPTAVRKLQEELSLLQIAEENEVRKILYTLTALVDTHMSELKINMDCMELLDFVFAKAKLSIEMDAIPAAITTARTIKLVRGRHPLLERERCVPLDFEIGGGVSGVVITGPNTGGKTVALKTVGLLSLMAQSGLHVPVGEGSSFSMHSNILCDIGDGQSISENLSTFSSHITNVIEILSNVSSESLVLLDELGSGTDPAEGMGLAVSILDELRLRGCLFVATTHYPEIKGFAENTEGLINARMEFDRESLKPLYRLEIGEAGESCALYIARRLGFPEHMLKRAHTEAYRRQSDAVRSAPAMEFTAETAAVRPADVRKIQKEIPRKPVPAQDARFQTGDSVTVYPQKAVGLVYRAANEKGEVGVQIKGEKQSINHKRLKLLTPASELYPAGYDLSIVFDSVENRKAHHTLERKHDPRVTINCEDAP